MKTILANLDATDLSTTTWMYVAYLIISVVLTVWVARTLHKHGRIFLVESFHGNEALADSVNHLLVVGFYLINIGYVTLALKYGDKPADIRTLLESLSTKVGFVLLLLGVMHFLNLLIFSKMRRRAIATRTTPPLLPTPPHPAMKPTSM